MKVRTDLKNLSNYKTYLRIKWLTEKFLKEKNYLKIELPVLSPVLIPESYLEIFKTEFKYFDKKQNLYLTPSPELFLKRLIVAGTKNCYYLGKAFRNEELVSSLHSFEFTMLEYYRVGSDYMGLADELLELLRFINNKLKTQDLKLKSVPHNLDRKNTLIYKDKVVSLDKWEKITVTEAFRKYANISEKELFSHKLFAIRARVKGYKIDGFSYEDLWSQIYVSEIEPHLGANGYPTLIYDYPREFAALAKLNSDGRTAQRFEFYIEGIELGDCYTELSDWKEQEKRFSAEQKKRKEAGKIYHPIDKGFVKTLKKGLPKCAGIAIGFSRLAMIFAGLDKIENLSLINIA